MTMTETRPADAPVPAADDHAEATGQAGPPAIVGVLGSGDPAVIGRLWIGTSLLFLLGGLVLAVLIGIESLQTTTYDVFSGDTYRQAFSLEHVGLVFLIAIPLLIGVGTVVVPRQVGAGTIAFPRAAALAYWGYLLGASMVVASYLINGGPFGGSLEGVDLFLLSLALVCVSLILASICIATTVLGLRPAGLSLDRVPAFAWSLLVATTIWVAGLAVLVGVLVLLYVDHRNRAFNFGGDSLHSGADIDRWLTFFRIQPQVYAIGIPALGFAADVVPTLTGRPQKRHGIVVGAIGALGVLSFGAWTLAAHDHPHLYREALFTAMAAAAVLPVLAILGGLGESIVKGTLSVRAPLLFALAAVLMLGAGVAVGALEIVAPFHLIGTTADDSILFYVVGAAVLTGIGAMHWWWPQLVGQHLKQPLASLAGTLLLLGTVLWALPLVVSGFLDEPFVPLVEVRDGVEALNGVSMVGAGLLAVGVLIFLANIAGSLGRSTDDAEIPTDPWDGFTLEWAADPSAVSVTSPHPLLDEKENKA